MDLAISRAVQSIDWPGFETLMRGVSVAGDGVLWPSAFVAIACLVLLALRARREAVVLLGVVLVGQILKVAIKNLVGRPRPGRDLVNVLADVTEVYSFPSGHTVHYVVFFGFLWFLTRRFVKSPLVRWPLLGVFGGLIALVGVSRVYLGVHWPSDIVGGYLLGGAVLAVGIGVYRRWSARTAFVLE